MILIDKATGKAYEFRGEYRTARRGDILLSSSGSLSVAMYNVLENGAQRAILHPITRRHTIGGVVFEEVEDGRPRRAKPGEFTLFDTGVVHVFAHDSAGEYIILRPVALESVTGGN